MGSEPFPFHVGCPMDVSRRAFLAGCSACAAGVSAVAADAVSTLAATSGERKPVRKSRVRLVFTHITPERPTWPNIGYDYEGRKKELSAKLTEACPDIEWLPVTCQNGDEAKKLLATDKDIDGYLVYAVGIWTGALRVFASSGKPVILVDDLYAGTGEFLIEYSRAKRAGGKVFGVSSSDFQDVADAANSFACIKKLQSQTILTVSNRRKVSGFAKHAKKVFGVEVKLIGGDELERAYQKADRDEAKKWSKKWMADAEKIVEPSAEEIHKSAVMYLAMLDLMKQYDAMAITIDCLGLFYAGEMSAYPCLGFWQMNNDGLVGACESDVRSTLSMVIMSLLTGRPGYISDPVVDTSKNQVIYSHCVAPTKVFGPDGPSNPYHIRSHSEDRKGAAIRSLLPLGEMTTTLEFEPSWKEVILHQGRSVENIDEDKACRTKLAVEVADARKMLDEWDRWGWHRVTFYGDLAAQVECFSALLGIKVTEEGQG